MAAWLHDCRESFLELSLVISHWSLGERKEEGISNVEGGEGRRGVDFASCFVLYCSNKNYLMPR
jgi:hypothetical protein